MYKDFFIQKSKSSINLNHKEGKQEGATINKRTTISDSWEKNISCVICTWDNFPGGGGGGGRFPRGKHVGDKSSERQFSSGEISTRILPWCSYLWGNFPETIIQGQSSRGQISGGG